MQELDDLKFGGTGRNQEAQQRWPPPSQQDGGMDDQGRHAMCVDAWLERFAAGLSVLELRGRVEAAFGALWTRTQKTLGEVTLAAIGGRVLCTAVEAFPFVSSFEVGPTRGTVLAGSHGPFPLPLQPQMRAGVRFLLVEFLSVIGNLTAEILTPELHAELMGIAVAPKPMSTFRSIDGLEQAHRRLEYLYEISMLFASFTNVEETFDLVLGIASRTLPLRSAVLIKTRDRVPHMFVWGAEGQSTEHMRALKANVQAAHRYLVPSPQHTAGEAIQETAMSPLTTPMSGQGDSPHRLIVLPLVVANRRPVGTLQIEGAGVLDKGDLTFVNAVANQLAVALDRDRAWREDIVRREHAEQRQATAETIGATSDRNRIDAEASSDRYQALASENARLYQETKQAVRVREQILAIVSHDLRNPLSTILMTAGVMGKRGTAPEAVGRIRRAADRMFRLIEDLLDFASIEMGTLAIRCRPNDAGAIIQEMAASFEVGLREKRLELRTDAAPLLPKVFCDRDRILQVLSNLVGNASKATAAGGHIAVRVELRSPHVLFVVTDDGPGISEEDAKHLFERYWRSGQAEYRGTGLGLAISRGIVVAHGGRLWVESKLGQGATFFFTIPSADEGSVAVAGEDGAPVTEA